MALRACFERIRRSRVWLAAVLFVLPFSAAASPMSSLVPVADINPSGGHVYFDRHDPATGVELWRLQAAEEKSLYLSYAAR